MLYSSGCPRARWRRFAAEEAVRELAVLSEVREAAVLSQPGEELPDRGGATGLGGLLAAEVRVVLDQINRVRLAAPSHLLQEDREVLLRVQAFDHGVGQGHASARLRGEVVRAPEHVEGGLRPVGPGNRRQGDVQVGARRGRGQVSDGLAVADRGDAHQRRGVAALAGDVRVRVPAGAPELLVPGREEVGRFAHRRVVQRLPHALERHLMDLVAHRERGDLPEQLVARQVPVERPGAAAAVVAGPLAPDLRGDAHGVFNRVAAERLHEDRLRDGAIPELEHHLRQV
mmetsp:Transcript_10772/g.31827  ORF Transcript_10772/g.31827 Transcript_10772/m.31827 type:complete len:286 (+) Transcript_10772:1-858(+)